MIGRGIGAGTLARAGKGGARARATLLGSSALLGVLLASPAMAQTGITFFGDDTFTGSISLNSPTPSSNAPTFANANAGVTGTLTGVIQRTGGDPDQDFQIGGQGTIVLTNTANNWTGTTRITAGATLRGTTGAISGNSILNNGTLDYTQSTDGSVTRAISGTGRLLINAGPAATITLSGANSYSGPTNVNSGTLVASGGAAIGDASTVTVASGASFETTGSETIGSLAGAGTVTINGTLTVGGNNESTAFSGNIGGGVLYVGSWHVSDGPAWSTHPAVYSGVEAAALLFGGSAEEYRISTISDQVAQINDSAWMDGYGAHTTYAVTPAPDDLHLDAGAPGYNGIGDFSAYIRDDSPRFSALTNYAFRTGGALTKTGTGTLTLSGTNSYTGTTAIQAGTLVIRGGRAIADSGAVDVSAGATFRVEDFETIGTLTGGGATTIASGKILTLTNASGSYSGSVTGGLFTIAGGNWAFGGTRSGGVTGIDFVGPNAAALTIGSLSNGAAAITGSETGISHRAGSTGTLSIDNHGTIASDNDRAIIQEGDAALLTLNNHAGGTIRSAVGDAISAYAPMVITNRGTITGGTYGIRGFGTVGITLISSGTITGDIAMELGQGADSITLEAGSVTNGAIYLGGGNDSLIYRGGSFGTVYAGAGTDSFTSDIGAGNAVSLALEDLVDFESHASQSGELTLTGTRTGGTGWNVIGGALALAENAALTQLTGTGITLDGVNGRVTIGAGASLESIDGGGIRSLGAGASIVNSGAITGIHGANVAIAGVSSAGADSSVENRAGATIIGNNGVEFTGTGASLTNAGTITATWTGVTLQRGGTVNNQAGGVIEAGSTGVLLNSVAPGTLVNQGTITGQYGVRAVGGGSLQTITNSGTIEAADYGVMANGGRTNLTNSGTITAGVAVFLAGTGDTLVNSGTITGTGDPVASYGVHVRIGDATITNLAGGTITGATAAMQLDGNGRVMVDLQAGSTVNGDIRSSGAGSRELTIAGALNGNYDSSGSTGVDRVTLAATGSIGSANLGAGDDIFVNYGGTITGMIDGGAGLNTLYADFGTGGAGTIGLDHFVNFDAFGLLSGDLTLTGASTVPDADIYAGNGAPAGTITFDGTTGLTGDIYVNGGTIRAATEGAFGSGTIHLIDPTAVFGATGSYANAISLEVQTPATADPATLRSDAGVVATLTGAITQGNGAGVDPAQQLVIGGLGTIVLTNEANSWAGTTTIEAGATLQGTTQTISGSSIVADGILAYVQPGSATLAKDVSGTGWLTVAGLAAEQAFTLAGTVSVDGGVVLYEGGTLINSGTVVAANGRALDMADGGVFVNDGTMTGSIRNGAVGTALVVNNGTITGTLANAGGALTFENAGVLAGGQAAIVGTAGSVRNTGDIAGTLLAVDYRDGVADIVNSGRIVGGTVTSGEYALGANSVAISIASGTIDNQAGGLIAGSVQGIAATGALTLTNAQDALIVGGLGINTQGAVDIANAGTIRGTQAYAIGIGSGTIRNSGTIEGGATANGWGVNSQGALTLVNAAGGTITGGAGAIGSFGDSTIDLQAGSTTIGGIAVQSSGASSVRIAGAYTGTLTLIGEGNTLELVSGLELGAGTLLWGGAGRDTLLLSGAGDQSLDAGMIRGFDAAAINGTGTWTLTGTAASGQGWQVNSGVLALSGGNAVADLAQVAIAEGAALRLLSGEGIGGLMGSGSVDLGANTLQLNGASDFAGTIGGTGGLVIANGAQVTLSGANSYTGGTMVAQGTLRLGADERLADAGVVAIGALGTFDLADRTETIAALRQAADGAGTLALGAGRLVVQGSEESAFGGRITGSGTIELAGSGRTTFAGAFDMTGRIDVSAGSLAFYGSSAGAMRLQNGALTGAGTLAGNLTIASGSFAPGGPTTGGVAQPFARWAVGSLIVSGGTLAFDVGGRSSGFVSDQILVRDAAVLSGGTLQISTTGPASDYVFSRDYVLIQADSLTGSFANGSAFDAVSNDDSLKWRLRYDLVPNAVVLQLQKALDFVEALPDGASANQFAVAGALNGSAGLASDAWATTLNEIAALDFGARPATYDTMSGEAIADLSTSTMLANRLFSDLLRQQIGSEDGLTGAAFAQNTGSAVRSAATDPGSKVNLLAASQEASGGGTRNGALWTQAFGGYQRLRGQAGQANVASSVGGVAMGAEVRLGAITLGAAGAVSEVDGDVDARFSRSSGTLYQAGGYAGYSGGIAFASLSGTWYGGDFTTQRTILLGGAAGSARGETHSEGYSFGATAGLRFDLGGGMRAALIASGTQTHDVRDGFVEQAAGGTGLEAARASRDLFTATGEVRLGQQIRTGSGSAMPFVSLGVRVNSGDLDTLGTMRFANAPTGLGGFTVEGARLSPVTGIVGTGIDAKVSDRFSLGVAAEAGFGGRTREGRASLRLRWGF